MDVAKIIQMQEYPNKLWTLSEIIVAILVGCDIDSGLAADKGYGYGLRKIIIGYRYFIR